MGQTSSQQESLFTTASERSVYNLLLRPEEQVYESVRELKIHADKFLSNKDSSKSLPHIILIQFMMHMKNESSLIGALENMVNETTAMNMHTSSIELLSSSRTIYLTVKNEKEVLNFKDRLIQELAKITRIDQKSLKFNASNLHITISKNVKQEKLEALFDNLKPMSFSEKGFACSNLILLKQGTLSNKWIKVASFNLPQ